jgi:two-component system cell cycle response regulator
MLRPPTAALIAAGAEGERTVAWARLVITSLLLIAPTWNLIKDITNPVYVLGFAVTLFAFVTALVITWLLRAGRYAPWMSFASTALDVTLVTLALALFMGVASPIYGVNSKVTFEIYFLTLAATALRYDMRICAMAGGLALAQYGSLVAIAVWSGKLHLDTDEMGVFQMVDQMTRLILIGSATLIAILLVHRTQNLHAAATTDPLTRIGNRTHFDRRARAEIERAKRYDRPLSFVLLDVDHFKQFNDVHGHFVGDEVLIKVATLLERNGRGSDVVARYGGEEFAMVLPEATVEAAHAKIDLIRRGIEGTKLDLADGKEPSRLTFSAGVAAFPKDGHSVDIILAVADDRLLEAKRRGRNRVVSTDGPA